MQQIPIIDTASQVLSATLGGQTVQLTLRSMSTGVYCDVYLNGALMLAGVACQNQNLIVRNGYLGVPGDLMFTDTQGSDDPVSPGLGSRFLLMYIEPSDLAYVGYSA